MSIYRETLYRDHVIWRKRVISGQGKGLFLTTSKAAVRTEEPDQIIAGSEITQYSQNVIADNAVQETTAVSFTGRRVQGNELLFVLPVETTRVLYDENINDLPPLYGKRPTVQHRLRYQPPKKRKFSSS